jgi:hypothetical protein
MRIVFESEVVAFLCVEGGERQVFWKPDWLVDTSLACHGLGIAQLPTGPEQKAIPTQPIHRHSVHEARKIRTCNQ